MQLAFFLPANKHPTSYEAAKLGVNVFPAIVYADFETAIHNAVTTGWQAWKLKHVVYNYDRAGGGK